MLVPCFFFPSGGSFHDFSGPFLGRSFGRSLVRAFVIQRSFVPACFCFTRSLHHTRYIIISLSWLFPFLFVFFVTFDHVALSSYFVFFSFFVCWFDRSIISFVVSFVRLLIPRTSLFFFRSIVPRFVLHSCCTAFLFVRFSFHDVLKMIILRIPVRARGASRAGHYV